jgi:hypothetical protein
MWKYSYSATPTTAGCRPSLTTCFQGGATQQDDTMPLTMSSVVVRQDGTFSTPLQSSSYM